jgi:hypothetical protein
MVFQRENPIEAIESAPQQTFVNTKGLHLYLINEYLKTKNIDLLNYFEEIKPSNGSNLHYSQFN